MYASPLFPISLSPHAPFPNPRKRVNLNFLSQAKFEMLEFIIIILKILMFLLYAFLMMYIQFWIHCECKSSWHEVQKKKKNATDVNFKKKQKS